MLQLGQAEQLASEFAATTLTTGRAGCARAFGVALALGQFRGEGGVRCALVARPGDPRARVGEARLLAIDRDLPGSMKVVEEVLAKTPGNAEALALKVELLLARNEREPAKQTLAQIIRSEPRNFQARYALITLLIDERGFDKAWAEVDAMKQAAPRDLRTRYLESLLAFSQGDAAKAKEPILEVLKVAPEHLPGGCLPRRSSWSSDCSGRRRIIAGRRRHAAEFARLLLATCAPGQPARARRRSSLRSAGPNNRAS
jgi:tetratricopeptide (TPR) repeat protein